MTVDVGGISGEITVSPSRLFFTTDTCPGGSVLPSGCWNRTQTVTVYTGEDFDAVDDTATLTHTVRGGDYTGVPAEQRGGDGRPMTILVGVTVSAGNNRADRRRRKKRYLYGGAEYPANEAR